MQYVKSELKNKNENSKTEGLIAVIAITGIEVRVCWAERLRAWGIPGFRLGLVVESADGIRTAGNRFRRQCIRFGLTVRPEPRKPQRLGSRKRAHRVVLPWGNRPVLVWFRFRFGNCKHRRNIRPNINTKRSDRLRKSHGTRGTFQRQ